MPLFCKKTSVKKTSVIVWLLSGFFFSVAYAQVPSSEDRIFEITDLAIKQTADDLVSAKNTGVAKAKQQAFSRIFTRLTGKGAGALQPAFDELENMVAKVRLIDEIFGGSIYLAKATITFDAQLVKQYLQQKNVAFIAEQSPKLLLIPTTGIGPETYLWSINNYWYNLWQQYLSTPQATHQIARMELARINDPKMQPWHITTMQSHVSSWKEAYQAPHVYRVQIDFPRDFDAEQQYRLLQTSAENTEEEVVAEAEETQFSFPIEVRVRLQEVTADPARSTIQKTTFYTLEANESGVYDLSAIFADVHTAISQYWLLKLLEESGDPSIQQTLNLHLMSSEHQDWIALQKTLSEISSVRYFRPVMVSPVSATMLVEFNGNDAVFARQLSEFGWYITPSEPQNDTETYAIKRIGQ